MIEARLVVSLTRPCRLLFDSFCFSLWLVYLKDMQGSACLDAASAAL